MTAAEESIQGMTDLQKNNYILLKVSKALKLNTEIY